jgi:hypothetical protein
VLRPFQWRESKYHPTVEFDEQALHLACGVGADTPIRDTVDVYGVVGRVFLDVLVQLVMLHCVPQ